MVNKPDDPRQPHPGDDPSHDALPEPKARGESDSAIDLSQLGQGEVSGISVVQWADLVAGAPSAESKLSIDAPSDMDLLAQLADEAEAAPAGEPAGDDDIVDLIADAEAGEEFRLEDEPPAPIIAAAADEDALFADMMAEGVDLSEPPVEEFAAQAGRDAIFEEEPDPASFVELGAAALIEDDVADYDSGAIVDIVTADSGLGSGAIDLGSEMIAAESASGAIDLGPEMIVAETPSGAIDLGSDMFAAETPSGAIDLGPDMLAAESASDVIDLDGGMIVDTADEPAGQSDVIDLGMDAYIDEGDAPSQSTGESSVLDFGLAETGSAARSNASASGGIDFDAPAPSSRIDSGLGMLAQDILLEQPNSPAPKKNPASRDFIAEELESGTDLLGSRKSLAKKAEEEALDDFLNETMNTDESSAVDLGSAADLALFDEAQRSAKSHGGKAADSDIRVEDAGDLIVGEDDYADIDLEAVGADAPKKGDKKPVAVGTDELEAFADEEAASAFADEGPVEKKGKKGKKGPEAEPGAEQEGEEEAPKKKKKEAPVKAAGQAKGRSGAWIGGTFLGTLVGVGAVGGLLFGGIIPSEYLGYLNVQPVGEKKAVNPGNTAPPPAPVAFDRSADHIRNGNLDQVKQEDLVKADEAKPAELVSRAEFHWLSYLRAERGKNPRAALKADAEPVKLALADIEKAIKSDNPEAKADALFLRGQIQELTGNLAGARDTYAQGAREFPAHKARFENAISIMDATGTAMALPPGVPREVLVALLVLFQAPPAGGEPDEAGYRFWQAMKLAREGKSAEAIQALAAARAAHDQRRFLFPRKPQNPKSDPREEIFLKACDRLLSAWAYQAKVKNPDYLAADAKDRIPEVDKLLDKSAEAAKAEQIQGLAKLFKDKKVDTAADLTALIEGERKAAEKEQLAQKTKLDDQMKTIDTLEAEAKLAKTKIETTEKALKESQAVASKALAEAKAEAELLGQIGKVVGAEFTDPKTSSAPLLQEVRDAVRISKMVDPRGTIRKLERDLAADRASLARRWEPAQMLGFWVPVLQKERGSKDLADAAAIDARRVLDDPASKAEAKSLATLVQGLLERNAEEYAKAKETLTKARAGLEGGKPAWLAAADEALREVSDPAAEIAKRVKRLEADGNRAEALAVLERGLKVLPDRKGPLYLQKAKMAFDAARVKGPLKATDPLVQAAQKDAAEAAKEGLPEGSYVAGQIDEALGRLAEAEASYRAAIKAHGKDDAEGARYEIALARLLDKSAAKPSARLDTPKAEGVALRKDLSLAALAVLSLTMFDAGDLPAERPPTSTEAEKIADKVLANPKATFDAKAQAYALKGLHSKALQVYTDGLLERGLLAPEYADVLRRLIREHPILRRPEGLTTADPVQAEKSYATGLGFYNARKFADAEKEFLLAVENDKSDARYYYFLGLSRLAQGNRDAYEDFEQGARLEQRNMPGRAAVSTALERVQGPMRLRLNEARIRPTRPAPK